MIDVLSKQNEGNLLRLDHLMEYEQEMKLKS